jgi:hypothetical protein
VSGKRHIGSLLFGGVFACAAGPALPQEMISNLPHQGILALRAPGQLDVAIIDAIADVGAKQLVRFPPGGDVAGFIGRKCGRPSLTVSVHPRYREKLIAANRSGPAAESDPLVLTEDRTLTLPACASRFATQFAEFEVPNGVQALMQKLSIPFDLARYQRLTSAPNITTATTEEYNKLRKSPYPDGPVCPASDLVSFFACVNAIEIAYLNRDRIKTSDQITGKLKVAVAPAQDVLSRVPIAADKADQLMTVVELPENDKAPYQSAAGISNLTPVASDAGASVTQPIAGVDAVTITPPAPTGNPPAVPALPTVTSQSAARFLPRTAAATAAAAAPPPPLSGKIENDVKLVPAVEDITKFDPACSTAHQMEANKGRWPFDAGQIMRVLALGYSPDQDQDAGQVQMPRLLVVDTGFDFTGDDGKVLPIPERYIFPRDSFALNRDKNRGTADGIAEDHFGYAGVNLAVLSKSSATHILDMSQARSHGLAVTTLAMGGRDLRYLRNLKVLKTKVGIASLVSTASPDAVLTKDHLDQITTYVNASTTDFKVINLSLSSRDPLKGFADQITGSEHRVFVAAAGNDNIQGKVLHEKDSALYPAALGGKPTASRLSQSVVITVGAHKGDGKLAAFSYFSDRKVDVLAPGCMIPSYELRRSGDGWADPLRVVESFVTGTSFAAPLVSFFASVLMTDVSQAEPGIVKERALVGTDFDADLAEAAFSSGRLNPAKMLSAGFDVLETVIDGQRRIRFGTVKNKDALPKIACSSMPAAFKDVRKLARDPIKNKVLLMSNPDRNVPQSLERGICDQPPILQGMKYQFDDAETGETGLSFDAATQVVDYVSRW